MISFKMPFAPLTTRAALGRGFHLAPPLSVYGVTIALREFLDTIK